MDQLVYVSKRELKRIKKLNDDLKKCPYLKTYIEELTKGYEEKLKLLTEQNEALVNKNKEYEENHKNILKLLKDIDKRIEVRDEKELNIIHEYLYGKEEDSQVGDA